MENASGLLALKWICWSYLKFYFFSFCLAFNCINCTSSAQKVNLTEICSMEAYTNFSSVSNVPMKYIMFNLFVVDLEDIYTQKKHILAF